LGRNTDSWTPSTYITAATPPYVLGQLMALGEYLAWNEARRIQSQLLRGADAGAALARDAGVKGPPR